jgi:hypothetical protein
MSACDISENLGAIEEALAASDPRLAAMLSTFTRLVAGEAMPGRERIRTGQPPTVIRAAFGLGPGHPARPEPPGTTWWHRLVRVSPVAVWMAISVALITVALLLSHSGGAASCARWPETACTTHEPAHPQAGHQVDR